MEDVLANALKLLAPALSQMVIDIGADEMRKAVKEHGFAALFFPGVIVLGLLVNRLREKEAIKVVGPVDEALQAALVALGQSIQRPRGRSPRLLRARPECLLALRCVDIGEPDLYLLLGYQDGDRVAIGDPDDAAGEGFGVGAQGPYHEHHVECMFHDLQFCRKTLQPILTGASYRGHVFVLSTACVPWHI